MKTLILTLATAASLTAAGGVATAQPGYRYGYGDDRRYGYEEVQQRINNLQHRIDRGVGTGQLDRREAWRIKAEMRDISNTERTYLRDGRLTGYERADLDRRLDMLSQKIRYDRHDNDRGDYRRYGYNTYRPY